MIFGQLSELSNYGNLLNLGPVLSFLEKTDLFALPSGDHDVQGKDVFVRVLRYRPEKCDLNKFETHREYADVQIVLKGTEMMQVVRTAELSPTTDYDPQGDYQFFEASKDISDIVVGPKEFLIFMPGDPHRPGCQHGDLKNDVFKIVFKVRKG